MLWNTGKHQYKLVYSLTDSNQDSRFHRNTMYMHYASFDNEPDCMSYAVKHWEEIHAGVWSIQEIEHGTIFSERPHCCPLSHSAYLLLFPITNNLEQWLVVPKVLTHSPLMTNPIIFLH